MGRSTYGGFPGTDRESPALVREAMEDLKKAYPIKHYFVGGHSQGGFLTYALLMNSPDLIAGAFPISAGLLIQAEPAVFEDKALKEAQRAVPLAIVHGKTDPSGRASTAPSMPRACSSTPAGPPSASSPTTTPATCSACSRSARRSAGSRP